LVGVSGYSGKFSGTSGFSGFSGYEFGTATHLVLSSGFSGTVDADTKTFGFSAFAGDPSFGLVGKKVLVKFWMSTTNLGPVDITPTFAATKGTIITPSSAAILDRCGHVLTDDNGAFEIDATITGAPGLQYFMASIWPNDVKSVAHDFT
jgi:hypothetical protein